WVDFKTRLEVYRAMGGRRDLRTLVSSSALEVLEELGVFGAADTPEAKVVADISALFAPVTVVDAYDRFRAVRMQGQNQANCFSVEAVLAYNQAYAQLYKLCPEDVRPSDARLRELYLRNLKPRRLAHCVSLREPTSLAEARKVAVQEVKKLHAMQS